MSTLTILRMKTKRTFFVFVLLITSATKLFTKRSFTWVAALFLVMMGIASARMIAPTVEAVSSENPAGFAREADFSVDGSGLNSEGQHSTGNNGVVWTTIGNMGATDYDPYIVYDLGAMYDVTMIRIWNYNSAFVTSRAAPAADKDSGELSTLDELPSSTAMTVVGPDLVEVFTSVNGVDFASQGTVHFKRATGAGDYTGQDISVSYSKVRYIKFDIKNNHDGAMFDGSGAKPGHTDARSLTGLSEVRFKVADMMDLVEIKAEDDALTVYEGGKGTEYNIRLAKQPESGSEVNIKVVPSDTKIKLNSAAAGMAVDICFSSKNWDKWKTITVDANDDGLSDPGYTSSIRHILASNKESVFNGRPVKNLSVSVIDDDKEDNWNEDTSGPIDPDKRMQWFRDIKYYWFIHWDPVSLAGTEISWSRGGAVPKEAYDQLYKKFNPTGFDADEWVRIAKAAGFNTLVITTKHHDGFCMWDTKTTDYDIMNTPFKRDIIKELAEACERQNFRFSIYYSIMDWYHPDWPNYYAGGPGYALPEGEKPNFDRYNKYMKKQVKELLTNYGPVSLLWWDGTDGRMAFAPYRTDEQSADLEAFTRKLQPAIVMNNRVGHWDGHSLPPNWWVDDFGDYDSSEMGLSHFNIDSPWEYTFTLGTQWAWRPNDSYKSKKSMIQSLLNVVGRDGNLLLNTSPPANGKFEDRVVKRLTEIGSWLKHHGESVYGTRGGPFKPGSWGVSTRKDNRVYLHIMKWKGTSLELPAIDKKITKSWLLTGGDVKVTQTKDKIVIDIPEYYQREIDTIVVLELDGSAMKISPIDT